MSLLGNIKQSLISGSLLGSIIYGQEESAPSFSRFSYDSNTLFFDFTDSSNTLQTTGDDTVAKVPELIHGNNSLIQWTKDDQPLSVTGGVNFNKDTNRHLYFEKTTGITNGKTGFYIAVNCKFDTADSNIISISRASSSTSSRGQVYISGSRNFGIKADDNDGGTPAFMGYTAALTLSTWYTLEMQFLADGTSTTTVYPWVNGTATALTNNANTVFAQFPSTDPLEITVGNWRKAGTDSFDGPIQMMAFYNGIAPNDIRTSISNYLVSVRPT